VKTRDIALLLSDGAYHSGQELGGMLGIGRSAVWKQVQALAAKGIKLDAVRGKGYRIIGGLDLLDANVIRAGMTREAQAVFRKIHVVDVVDSTNSIVLSGVRQSDPDGYVCFAEQQTSGRGRRGRHWISPYAKNLYFSLAWTFDAGFPAIQGLSLAVAISICRGLESLGVNGARIKWPNDICNNGEKFCGILIEVVGDISGACTVVIGVGLNVSMATDASGEISQPWSDLSRMGCTSGRNEIASKVLSTMAVALRQFHQNGLSGFMADWDRLDALVGRAVEVHLSDSRVTGIAIGITAAGALLVETCDGVREFSAGEVSIRGWQ
jgi:BirA family biotin operon repressor/biotin-[acetyl-CoA-carboxylase] ligase